VVGPRSLPGLVPVRGLSALSFMSACLLAACSTSSPAMGKGDAGAGPGNVDEFFSLLRFTRAEGLPRTGAQLIVEASNVVRGHFVAVQDGRTIDFATGAANPIHTAVFEIGIDKTLKGPVTSSVYMEFVRGGIEVQAIRELLPTKLQMIVFLHSADGWDPAVYRFEGAGKGHPPDTSLLTYLTQEGVVIETAAGLRHPMSDNPQTTVFDPTRIKSLDDLEREVTR
jgi:hypothetical protein